MGLAAAQGLNLTAGFYWDQSPESRAFARRFMAQAGMMPGKDHAAVYTAVLHYLQAVRAGGHDGGGGGEPCDARRPGRLFRPPGDACGPMAG